MKTESEKKEITSIAKKISKLFKIEVTIYLFGKVLIHWVYPPKNNEGDE